MPVPSRPLPSRRRPPRWIPPTTFGAPIRTPRLLLRPLAVADAEVYHRLIDEHRGQLLPWMPWAATEHQTADQTRERLRQLAEHDDDCRISPVILGVFDRHDRTLIGACSVHAFDPQTGSAEAGFWIAQPFTGRGLATEAVAHLISTALRPATDGGWGLNRIHFSTAGSNTAARGVMKALGLRREMRRRQDQWIDDVGVDDTYGWGVVADEWDVTTMRMVREESEPDVGVGPHPSPWPTEDRYDPLLLRDGDRRNVADRYRYWRHGTIVDDLAANANPFHVAIENWRHDNNIGTVVRNANAFGAAGVHIVGRRGWNRRGAMVTDRYLTIHHHPDIAALEEWANGHDLAIIGIDNLPGSVSIFDHPPPERAVLLMGQEGPGLSDPARDTVAAILHIPQFGSTRSINAGVASGIAMAAWVRTHRPGRA